VVTSRTTTPSCRTPSPGDIENDDTQLPNTFAWTEEFVTQDGVTFNISPDFEATDGLDDFDDIEENEDVDNLVFDVRNLGEDDFDNVTEEITVTGDDLRSIDLDDEMATVSAPGEGEFNLLRHAGDHNGSYSMDSVPAQDRDTEGVDDRQEGVQYTSIAGVQYVEGDRGTGESSNPVRPGITQEGNIVITAPLVELPGDDPDDSDEFDVGDYENEDGVVDTDGLRAAIDDWRNGDIETDDLRTVIDAWRSG